MSEQQPGSAAESDHADVVALPPLIYLVGLVVGVILKWTLGGSLAWIGLSGLLRWALGVSLLLGGVALAVSFSRAFDRAGQDRDPRTPTPSIITDGLYRYSRNPAYLGLTMILVGLGCLLNNLWVVVSVVPVLAVMHHGVILREEAYLERKFGDSYREYKSQVRRWL